VNGRRLAASLAFLLALGGCSTTLVHPTSGAVARCTSWGWGWGALVAVTMHAVCVHDQEARGFVRAGAAPSTVGRALSDAPGRDPQGAVSR